MCHFYATLNIGRANSILPPLRAPRLRTIVQTSGELVFSAKRRGRGGAEGRREEEGRRDFFVKNVYQPQ
jgi:hypothetical protein